MNFDVLQPKNTERKADAESIIQVNSTGNQLPAQLQYGIAKFRQVFKSVQ